MFPIGGYVFLKKTGRNETTPTPYKILRYFRFLDGDLNSSMYYDLEGTDIYYRYHELEPASKEDALYDKLTQHIEEE